MRREGNSKQIIILFWPHILVRYIVFTIAILYSMFKTSTVVLISLNYQATYFHFCISNTCTNSKQYLQRKIFEVFDRI